MTKLLDPILPGEILEEEFLKPFEISQSALARNLGVSHRRINEIIRGKRAISPDTALRLAAYFGTSAEFWINLQMTYELRLLKRKLGSSYSKIQHFSTAA